MNAKKKMLIGCSGYYYPNWKNKFYPPKLASSKWLDYYSSVFNTVELNGTFYRMPKLSDLKRQADRTPPEFKFSVKMNRYVTHVLRLNETSGQIEEFMGLIKEGLGQKLHRILFQMPPSFLCNEENLHRLREAELGNRCVVEFRHPSWWRDEVTDLLRSKKCTFCNVDLPGMEAPFRHSTKDFYLRLHGNPILFKSSYSKEKLVSFYEQIPAGTKECAVYFNNTYYSAGYENARLLMELAQQ